MSTTYEMVIGVEVHARLATRSKMFCGCANRFGAAPGTLACPVCAGLPGSLPVPNRRAFELGLRVCLALSCRIGRSTRFDRKHYFYPDLPKNYQITQYDEPLGVDGRMEVDLPKEGILPVRIRRVHLEEDAGKNLHGREGGSSLVDLNRAGAPLVEIVTEPDFRSPSQAKAFLQALQRLLRTLEVSNANMEEGSLRGEPNLSLRPAGADALGVKTEIKNLNSFGAVERALRREAERQRGILEAGGRVRPETLLWDEGRGETRPMRSKEEAHDYRYFPEPDIPPVRLDAGWVEEIRGGLAELPLARRRRFERAYGLDAAEAGILTEERALADAFEACVRAYPRPADVSRFYQKEVRRLLNEKGWRMQDFPVPPEQIARLLRLVEEGGLNPAQARACLAEAASTGRPVDAVRKEKGLEQLRDASRLSRVVAGVVAEHPRAVEHVRRGKEAKAVGHLMGVIMRETGGRADPKAARSLLVRALREAAGEGRGNAGVP